VLNLAGIKVGAGLQTLETLNGGGDVAPGLERRPIADGIRHLAMFIDRGERLAAVPVNDFGGHRRNQTWLFQGKRPLGWGQSMLKFLLRSLIWRKIWRAWIFPLTDVNHDLQVVREYRLGLPDAAEGSPILARITASSSSGRTGFMRVCR
jgi:hypothetical protein